MTKQKLDIISPNLVYDVGDLITGIDRSYERSIYKLIGFTSKTVSGQRHGRLAEMPHALFQLISFSKRPRQLGERAEIEVPLPEANNYRLATREELIEEGVIPQSVDFITEDN